MAKATPNKSGTSKVRLIVFEAEVNDGDLSQFTHAIQNALQPRPTPIRVIQAPNSVAIPAADNTDLDEDDFVEEADAVVAASNKPRAERPAKTRNTRMPVVINDLDVKSEPALADYVGQFDVKTAFEKYLAVAHWFREARGVDSINIDHVYTCFRLLGWPTGSTDFEKPFRNMRANQWVIGGSKEGYTLTLTGADKIEKRKLKP